MLYYKRPMEPLEYPLAIPEPFTDEAVLVANAELENWPDTPQRIKEIILNGEQQPSVAKLVLLRQVKEIIRNVFDINESIRSSHVHDILNRVDVKLYKDKEKPKEHIKRLIEIVKLPLQEWTTLPPNPQLWKFLTSDAHRKFLEIDCTDNSTNYYRAQVSMATQKEYTNSAKTTCEHVSLNRIFYGPPGTGKTYHTINAALEIFAPELMGSARDLQKARFDMLASEGKIRFVTFHQSFSYEDFVEGIRPNITDEESEKGGALSYSVVAGIFKEICEAAQVRTVQPVGTQVDLTNRKFWKMSLGDSYKDKATYEYCLQNNVVLMGYGREHDFTAAHTREDIRSTLANDERSNELIVGMVYAFTQKMQRGDIIIVPEGLRKIRGIAEVTGDYAYFTDEVMNHKGHAYRQSRPVRWLCQFNPPMPVSSLQEKQFSQLTLYSLSLDEKEKHNIHALISPSDNAGDKYVLIIDEINRGNISGIFGELITLLEPSKRLGNAEELMVTLPYSRETFGVPNNLYIIGTMNTADRSLTGLDIALRRRFDFIEMPPKYSLLEDKIIEGSTVSLKDILLAMNERIELLLGRDYCLGHAPFMHLGQLNNEHVKVDDLRPIFQNTVIPLLQEYFFEDWRKIHIVLNDHKKPQASKFIVQKNISSQIFDDDDLSKFSRELWGINQEAFGHVESYINISNPT